MRKRRFIEGRGYARDRRDHKLSRGKSKRKSRYWNDTRWFGDQGSTPHCVGFGWAHWLHCGPTVNWADPDGIYRYAKFVDEWQGESYDGTSVRAGAKVLHHLGLIESYAFTTDLDTLVYTLLEQGPVTIGVNWHEGMMDTDASGLITPTGEILGGHCCLLTGINVREGLARGKNSWGKLYGLDGRFWITLDDLARLIREEGEVCCAQERKGEPR